MASEFSCHLLYLYGFQRTSFDTVPASHAHVDKNHRWLKTAVQLLDHFMGASRYRRAGPLFGVAHLRVAALVIDNRKCLFGLHIHFDRFPDPFKPEIFCCPATPTLEPQGFPCRAVSGRVRGCRLEVTVHRCAGSRLNSSDSGSAPGGSLPNGFSTVRLLPV